MPQNHFSVLDLLDLPPLEREIMLAVSRTGPADAGRLAQALDRSPLDIESALAALEHQKRITRYPNGQVDIVLGHIQSHTALPEQIWPALLSAERVYSQHDIAILQTAFPMLQFARMRLSNYADHGPAHALRVKSFATQLGYLLDINPVEHRVLRSAALFHDIGNIVEREQHHVISQKTVVRLAALGRLPFSAKEAELVGQVCRWHRREYEPERVDALDGMRIRTGLLASILRVADAMDIDQRRSDYDRRLRDALEFYFPEEVLYFTSLEEIAGVRVHGEQQGEIEAAPPQVSLQVFTHVPTTTNIQIEGLKKDIAGTPLRWPVTVRTVSELRRPKWDTGSHAVQRALLAFPLEPHSLIMAAISRRHLEEAGCQVKLLCYPDCYSGTAWLWGSALPAAASSPDRFQRLIVIGDRPAAVPLPRIVQTIHQWQNLGARICVLNRHEANWERVPWLLEAGVEIILGSDWAYYWGDETSAADIAWARIAALCNHDPTFSMFGVTDEEVAVMRGLLYAVYTAASQTADDSANLLALVQPIFDRISTNDRRFFAAQAGAFIDRFATPLRPGKVNGRLVYFDAPPGASPDKCQWALEAAIEQLGRGNMRGIHFNTPYAVAAWQDRDGVELVAINHWREEDAIPIRLLYPSGIGPEPRGLESIIQVRLTPDEARAVVDALVYACNQ